jgi:hypothetical protein
VTEVSTPWEQLVVCLEKWMKFPRLESRFGPLKFDFPVKWCHPVTHNFTSRSCALDNPLHIDIRVAKFLGKLIWSISEFVSSYVLPQTDSAFNVNIWCVANEEEASSPRTDAGQIKDEALPSQPEIKAWLWKFQLHLSLLATYSYRLRIAGFVDFVPSGILNTRKLEHWIPNDGQSPETDWVWILYLTVRTFYILLHLQSFIHYFKTTLPLNSVSTDPRANWYRIHNVIAYFNLRFCLRLRNYCV